MHRPSSIRPVTSSLPEILDRGYTILPFLDAREVAALKAIHDTTQPEVPRDLYNSAFASPEERRRTLERIMEVVEPKARELMPGYRTFMASFVTKRPRTTHGRMGMHQDYSFVDHETHLGLNLWAPLCDVDERNGCMRMGAYTQRFGHISAMPPNPGPYAPLYRDVEAHWLSSVPMSAGDACVFDTRVLHATEENRTDSERVALFMNFVPANAPTKLYLWNTEFPKRLELYHIDAEWMLRTKPNTYPDEASRQAATFVEFVDYDPPAWTREKLEATIPRPAPEAGPVEASAQATTAPSSTDAAPPKREPSIWRRLLGGSRN